MILAKRIKLTAGILLLAQYYFALTARAEAPAPIKADGINGTLVLVGGGTIPNAVKELIGTSLKDKTLVIIGTASASPESASQQAAAWIRMTGVRDVRIVPHTADRQADAAAMIQALQVAQGVWICGGQQSRLANTFVDTQVESELKSLLNRGGLIGGSSAGAAIMSRVMIASGNQTPNIEQGWDLLPDAIIDQHFTQRNRQARLRHAIAEHRQRIGLGIDENTCAIVTGRTLKVSGEGCVSVLLAQSPHLPAYETQVRAGEVADWIQLTRAARNRGLHENSAVPRPADYQIQAGSLVIVGGGQLPQDVVDRFVELAGGRRARIVVLPTAGSRQAAFRAGIPSFLLNANVADVRMLPHSRPAEVSSVEFREALRRATGIWFGGGRQWNFVDAYEGTVAVELFRDVLRRGGVIGGSSAGATIQGDYLVRGHPLGNTIMMAEGYERGFAFLPGVAIDQHFSQRKRADDLKLVIRQYPQYLGIGIDEGTALIVKGNHAQVAGMHAVHFLSGKNGAAHLEYSTARSGAQVTFRSFSIQDRN